MYTKFSTIAIFISAAAAIAIPRSGTDQCNVGSIQCCNSVQEASDSSTRDRIGSIFGQGGLLGGINLDDFLNGLTGQVGVQCTPINVIGLGGNSCSAQPTCCTGNNFNGLIATGCTPININV
ncbi:hypothetical protein Ac2012v2_001046 [Leucoagaricus gongylophorus]